MTEDRDDKPDLEVGIREARATLRDLIDQVERDGAVVYLTRNGRRAAALVAPSFEPRTDSPKIWVPRSTRKAIGLVEAMLTSNSELMPDILEELGERRGDLVGELAILITVLYAPFGQLSTDGDVFVFPMNNGDDEAERRISLEELIMPRLFRERHGSELYTGEGIPIVAGGLWALKMGEDLHGWRNSIDVPISGDELMTWISATILLADFTNTILGDGAAQEIMYRSDEWLRDDFWADR
ncbi:type II toxin-antitoxin system Phd/YefM family antitoxin [Streptomyces yerevanensis]|uniref:type II toxin-antitoxin system Phd/YefM family antitoxin n=1 Tax=Streptomyces yerevanensis TaxID=66378 RepID=UPI00099752D8|nr:type II toxin-antitoxin system Phd/YefM family antitoxin [Streptomyces yerevanensis]